MSQTVAILGASAKPERFAHSAMIALLAAGHRVLLVHPRGGEIAGLPVFTRLDDITVTVDTLTLYVAAPALEKSLPALLQLHPGRVIFNPGTESAQAQAALDAAAIPWQEDCTLVMLRQGRF